MQDLLFVEGARRFVLRLRWHSSAFGTVAVVVCIVLVSCRSDEASTNDTTAARPSLFEDVTATTGLNFVHETGTRVSLAMPGIMAGGGAVFDYDNDGDLDLYFVQSGNALPGDIQEADQPTPPNQLYRQDSDGTFHNATIESASGDTGYGMGATVGDIDNDGDLDLFVSNFGEDVLLRNNADGTFTDTTHAAGIANPGWSMSSAFLDYNRDGFLDLYVTRYVRYDPAIVCTLENGRQEYCGPTAFAGEHDLLYRNQGNGTFTDVSVQAGLQTVRDAGLGVVAADLDADGWIDLYVANDADPNNLWINQGDGTFVDRAVMLGVAYNRYGASEAGMGVAIADVDANGHLDLFVTHLIEESNTLYTSLGTGGFTDGTAAAGLGIASLDLTGFGTAFFDYDNDGTLDSAVVNGAVKRRPRPHNNATAEQSAGFWGAYAEPNLLFRGQSDGSFAAIQNDCGSYCSEALVSRALMPADLDQDGGLDLVVTGIEQRPRVYRNRAQRGNWIGVRVLLPEFNREALGATLAAWTGNTCAVRAVSPIGGYLTGGHATVHLGLGTNATVERFEVLWPNGETERFVGAAAGTIVDLAKGDGQHTPGPSWTEPCIR